ARRDPPAVSAAGERDSRASRDHPAPDWGGAKRREGAAAAGVRLEPRQVTDPDPSRPCRLAAGPRQLLARQGAVLAAPRPGGGHRLEAPAASARRPREPAAGDTGDAQPDPLQSDTRDGDA